MITLDSNGATVTIWHNPRCSKSREALRLLKERRINPVVFLYLETPPSVDQIREVCRRLDVSPQKLVRRGELAYRFLTNEEKTSDELLILAMAKDPIIIERPIVISSKGAVIGRPPENVLQIIN